MRCWPAAVHQYLQAITIMRSHENRTDRFLQSSDDEERSKDINVCGNEDCLYDSEATKLSLFEGSEFTFLETIAAMFDWFASHPNVSKSAFSDMLTLQHSLVPNSNVLPSTYLAAEKYLLSHFFYLLLFIMHVPMTVFCSAKHQGMITPT